MQFLQRLVGEGILHEDIQGKNTWTEGAAIAKALRQRHAWGVQGSQNDLSEVDEEQ